MIRATSSIVSTIRKSHNNNHFTHILTKSLSTLKDSYEYILVSKEYKEDNPSKNGIGTIKLNRPKTMNALCDALFDDLIHAAKSLNEDDSIGCLLVTSSSNKAFAAGADISEMSSQQFSNVYKKVCFTF